MEFSIYYFKELSVKICIKWAAICDFQQCGILTSVDSDEPVQPQFKIKYLFAGEQNGKDELTAR